MKKNSNALENHNEENTSIIKIKNTPLYKKDDVVKISGITGENESLFNGEFKITKVTHLKN
jgi:hypothetical protein